MRFKSIAIATLVATLGLASLGVSAAQEKTRTVADLYKNKASLAGKTIRVQGKVVKANNGIKGYNFLHLQDGTGAAGTNDLTVRSKQTASVGDQVVISGTVVVDKDFGAGYFYPLIIEEATVSPKK
jgi:hypothetical protein